MAQSETIAVIGPDAERHKGGVAQFTSALVTALRDRAPVVHVTWSALYPRFAPRRSLPGSVASHGAAGREQPRAMLDVSRPSTWCSTADYLIDTRISRVVFTWIHPIHALVLRRVSSRLRQSARQIAICHNVLPHERFPFSVALARFGLRHVAGLVVHSDAERRLAEQLGLPQPVVVPMPLPFTPRGPRRRAHRDDGTKRLLFFGTVRRYKGVDLLIRALPEVRARSGDVRLHIAGERLFRRDPDPAALAKKLGLEDVVTIDERYIPDSEIPSLFEAADLAVFPFRSATQSASLLAALAYGVPVVSTRLPPIEEVLTGGLGVMAEAGSVESLSKAISRGLEDSEPADLAAICRERSWNRYAELILRELGEPGSSGVLHPGASGE